MFLVYRKINKAFANLVVIDHFKIMHLLFLSLQRQHSYFYAHFSLTKRYLERFDSCLSFV